MSQPPEIILAHRYQTPHYEMAFPRQPEHFEITAIEQGRILRKDGFVYEEGSIALLHHSEDMALFSDAPLHSHCTFAFRLQQPLEMLTAEEAARWIPRDNCMLLPDYLPPGKLSGEAQNLIRQIVTTRSTVDPGHFLTMRSAMYRLFSLLTGAAVTIATQNSGNELQNQFYCLQAAAFINGHIHEKISAADAAAHVGISYGYLSRIFRRSMGMTLVEYTNHAKIRRVRELLAVRKITLTEAGLAVGIDDVKYLSRMFKKYTGVTCAKYREMCHLPSFEDFQE